MILILPSFSSPGTKFITLSSSPDGDGTEFHHTVIMMMMVMTMMIMATLMMMMTIMILFDDDTRCRVPS